MLTVAQSGFVASRVIDVLLKRGYEVVGTVRSVSKGQAIVDRYPEHKDKLSIVGVEDVATSDLSEAVSGVNAILRASAVAARNELTESLGHRRRLTLHL